MGLLYNVICQWGGMGRGYGGYGCGMGHGGWFGGIFMAAFWVLVIVALVYLIRWMALSVRGGGSAERNETPLDIVKKRYASGEIDREEFEQKKKDLL